MKNDDGLSFWNMLEAALFPLAAVIIGVGYTAAIFINNPLQIVLHSPHAIILIVILLSIAFFPLRSMYHLLKKDERETQTDTNN